MNQKYDSELFSSIEFANFNEHVASLPAPWVLAWANKINENVSDYAQAWKCLDLAAQNALAEANDRLYDEDDSLIYIDEQVSEALENYIVYNS